MYLSNFNEKLLWELIVATKVGLLLDRDWSTLDCFVNSDNVLFSHLTQQAFFQFYLTRTLKPFIDNDIFKTNIDSFLNISHEQLKTFGEMFIYWNLCPKFMYDWTEFYIDLMQNASPDIIVQTLNRIMVTAKIKGDKSIFDIAKNIFLKIGTSKGNFHFQTIDTLTKIYQNSSVVDFQNYNWTNKGRFK